MTTSFLAVYHRDITVNFKYKYHRKESLKKYVSCEFSNQKQ